MRPPHTPPFSPRSLGDLAFPRALFLLRQSGGDDAWKACRSVGEVKQTLQETKLREAFPFWEDLLDWEEGLFLASTRTFAPLTHEALHFHTHEISALRFSFGPHVWLFASPYPLDEICEKIDQGIVPKKVQPHNRWALVLPCAQGAQIHWLSWPEWAFLDSLQNGYTFYESVEKTRQICEAFCPERCFERALTGGAFASVYVSRARP